MMPSPASNVAILATPANIYLKIAKNFPASAHNKSATDEASSCGPMRLGAIAKTITGPHKAIF
jgi:hypothetical protein